MPQADLVQGTPRPQPSRHSRLRAAVDRARRALEAQQHPDGSFECEIDVGPVAIACQLILEDFAKDLGKTSARLGLEALRRAQREDGSFVAWVGAKQGSVEVTMLAVAAMRAAGAPANDPAVRAANAFANAGGGLATVSEAFRTRGESSAIFLAAAGVLPATQLPSVPLSVLAAPLLERFADGRVHAGNLMVAFVIAAVASARQERRRGGLFRAALGSAMREIERRRATDYLTSWQNPDGSFNQSVFPTQLMALGLAALGGETARIPLRRALDWLSERISERDGAMRIQAIPNDIWGTAQAGLALRAAGADPSRGPLARALQHLRSEQLRKPQPRANQRKRDAVRTGGWAFQRGNPTMPDCDDTGLVLAVLGRSTPTESSREAFRSIDAGVAWLRSMQNPDGGWSAYVWDLPSKKPGPMFVDGMPMPDPADPKRLLSMFLDPPAELGDPSTEGLTGRALMGLGACGVGRDDAAVCRAIEFLQAHQCESGAFWDRWMTCYLPGTATVLMGLAAVGEDMDEPWVRRAIDWMCAQQNDDGGFGEQPEAFSNPSLAGQGPSMPPVTGYVLSALVHVGLGHGDVARRAVDHLLAKQRSDGRWDPCGWVNPYVPPDTFYTYELASTAVPLEALATAASLP